MKLATDSADNQNERSDDFNLQNIIRHGLENVIFIEAGEAQTIWHFMARARQRERVPECARNRSSRCRTASIRDVRACQ